MSFEVCAFRYVGNDKDFTIEDPWGKDCHIHVGNGKPFLVPPLSREFYLSINLFKEVSVPKGAVHNILTKALSDGNIENMLDVFDGSKVLFIAPDEGGYTGARYHAYQIALSLARQNCRVFFTTSHRPIFARDIGLHHNIVFDITPNLEPRDYSDIDFVVAAPPQGLEIGRAIAKEKNVPFYPICFEPNVVLRDAIKGHDDVLGDESEYYKDADKVIVNSDLTQAQVSELWGIPDNNIVVVKPAINFDEIMHAPIKEGMGNSLVYVGRASNFKGLYDFIDILHLRGKDLPPFTFHVVSREANHVKKAKGEGTSKHPIQYHENISDYSKFSLIKGCTAGIQLSKHEGFGMVPAEFLACGKPVLCRPIEQIKNEYGDMVWYADTEDEICQFVIDLFDGKCVVPDEWSDSIRKYSMEKMQEDVSYLLPGKKSVKQGRYECKIQDTGRPRILFVTKYSYDEPIFGGAESTIKKHAETMRDVFGFDIFYAFSLDNKHKQYRKAKCYKDDFAWRFEIPKTPFLKVGTDYQYYLSYIIDIVSPDVVMTYAEPIFSVGPLCRAKKIPYVVSVNFWRCLTNRFDNPEDSRDDELHKEGLDIIQHATGIIANSEYTKTVVEKLSGRKDSVVIHSPVVPDKVVATDNLEKDCIGITVCESGDARYLLRAIVKLMPEEKFLIGQFRGEEPVDGEIKSSHNVEYLGGFVDPKEFYRRVKMVLVITPTLSHSFCKTALEGMLNGVPVVVSNKGNLPYLVGDSGVLIDGDARDWVDSIKSVLNNPDMYKELSDKGRARGAEFCDEQAYKDGIEKALVKPYILKPGIITLECPDFPGVQASLRSIEAVVPGTKFVGSNFSNKNLSLLSGWLDGYQGIIDKKNAVMLDWHSPISQSELTNELGLLHKFLKYVDNHKVKKIFFRDEKTAAAMKELFGPKIDWLPNVIDIEGISSYASSPYTHGFHVSIFCPGHPRKNIIAQTIAAKLAGAKLHVNEWIASNQTYLNLIKQICPDVSIESMKSFSQLLQTKSKMHVGLEVTWSESFNYSLMEYLLLGVPVLAPATTPAFEEIVKDEMCREWLVIENPGDPLEISGKLQNIKENGYISELKDRVKQCIIRTANRRNEIAIKALRGGTNGSRLDE